MARTRNGNVLFKIKTFAAIIIEGIVNFSRNQSAYTKKKSTQIKEIANNKHENLLRPYKIYENVRARATCSTYFLGALK